MPREVLGQAMLKEVFGELIRDIGEDSLREALEEESTDRTADNDMWAC